MKCIRMLTFLPLEQIDEMSTWKDQQLNQAKEILAFELTKMVHGEEEAKKAQEGARALFGAGANTCLLYTSFIKHAPMFRSLEMLGLNAQGIEQFVRETLGHGKGGATA